jgi:hypothetical protein
LALKEISTISNVVPVIAKSDTLTLEERESFKKRIKEELSYHHINIYPDLADLDSESLDPVQKSLNDQVLQRVPWYHSLQFYFTGPSLEANVMLFWMERLYLDVEHVGESSIVIILYLDDLSFG